ncbi:MAG: outer membrane beta-barrel protein [Crocinitomicaceae bacterium]|nr:outer membrane beta-barrel protein [Crocinitomicaceae bacterium]
MRKSLLILLLIINSSNLSLSQEGLQLGVDVSPCWVLNTHRQKSSGIRSAESGYGFNAGLALKYWFSEKVAVNSGLTFEYNAFDNRFNNQLISSRRFGSLHLPVMVNYAMSGNWYLLFGGGINYNVINQSWSGYGVDISSQINAFQPYGGIGVSTLMERDKGLFEFGVTSRYHFLELWKSDAVLFDVSNFTSRILSFDLILRFYLFQKV